MMTMIVSLMDTGLHCLEYYLWFLALDSLLYMYIAGQKAAKEREILKKVRDSPLKTPPVKAREEVKPVERHSGLVFFVEEHERFILEDLFEATADLQSQTVCSSLYKVVLKNSALYAVKRLKQLQVSFEEFSQTMIQIGSLKHPNILPLVGYHSTNKEELFIYKYQSQGSLLNSLEDYIDGKRDFPWELRLSIASGIASGLNFIYQSSDNQEIIPHGNLKLSNILDENNKALISEYGFSRFLNPKACNLTANGYTAPEKLLAEQGDVFSFGVILLELLTSKTVEKSGIDLPKWVRAMVSEEWTGEVFDREVSKAATQWEFPLLDIALKCILVFSHFIIWVLLIWIFGSCSDWWNKDPMSTNRVLSEFSLKKRWNQILESSSLVGFLGTQMKKD
nr:putative inactive receptor kinase [Quercus suber]